MGWPTRDDVDAATCAASMAQWRLLKDVITQEGNARAQASRISWLPNGCQHLSIALHRL